MVSVPCRGAMFLNKDVSCTYESESKVSVPCRGAMFLNWKDFIHYPHLKFWFPSPVGELCFSIRMSDLTDLKENRFRPLSGSYVSQSNLRKGIR